MLSGATGQLYGNHYTWQFLCDQRDQAGNCVGGWKDHLDTSGAIEFKHMTDLFQSLPWYQLVPDSNHTLLTGGSGTYGDWDYATAPGRVRAGVAAPSHAPARCCLRGRDPGGAPGVARTRRLRADRTGRVTQPCGFGTGAL